MPTRPILALALASALTGCVAPLPPGPVAEYRPGSLAVTGKAACDASYTIVARDAAAPVGPFGEHRLRKGDQVWFRPEADGTVTALAPGYSLTLPAGSYAWEAVPGTVPSKRERWLCETRKHALTAFKVTGVVLAVAVVAVAVLIVVAVASMAFNFT